MEDAVNILEKFWPLLILIAFLLFYVSSPEEVAVGAQAFSPVPEKRKSCSDFQWYLWSYQGIA